MTKKDFIFNLFSLNRFLYFIKDFSTNSAMEKTEMLIVISFWFIVFFYDPLIFIATLLIPFFFIRCPLSFIIQLPEHYKANRNSKDPFENTMKIEGNFIDFFIAH